MLCACVQVTAVRQEKAKWEVREKELESSLQKQRQANSDLTVSSRSCTPLFLYYDLSLSLARAQVKMEGMRNQHSKELQALKKKHADELEEEVARLQKEKEAQAASFRAAQKKV